MALFGKDTYVRQAGSSDDIKRTFNGLEISEGMAPANKYLVDPRVSRKFKYQFNVKQNEWVCIPKGIIVGIATNADFLTSGVDGAVTANTGNATAGYYFREYESKKLYHALTVANGGVDVASEPDQRKLDLGTAGATYTRTANIPLGVLFKNAYYKVDDRMFGAGASVITRAFVELPYVPDTTLAGQVAWGCATGTGTEYLRPGDYVKSDSKGHFVKWNPGTVATITEGTVRIGADDPRQIVGQVWDVTGQLQPEGWLQWVMWNLDMVDEDLAKVLGLRAQDLQTQGYPYGYPFLDKVQNMWRYEQDEGRGIEGLTDGSNILTTITDEKLYPGIPAGAKTGEKYFFHLKREAIVEASLKLYQVTSGVKGAAITVGQNDSTATFKFERFQAAGQQELYGEGGCLIVIEMLKDAATAIDLVVDFDAYGMVPGVPTLWDLKGSVGATRILLGGCGK